MDNYIGFTLVTALITIVLFLIFRELANWYWKINERVSILKSIDKNLKLLVNNKVISSREQQTKPSESETSELLYSKKTRKQFMIELINELRSTDIGFSILKYNCISGLAYKKGLTFYFVINWKKTHKSDYKIVFGLGVNKVSTIEKMNEQYNFFSEVINTNKELFDAGLYKVPPNKAYGSFEIAYKGLDWSVNESSWPTIHNELVEQMSKFIETLKPFIDKSP